MKHNAFFIVFKKELARFFGDFRLAFVTILLPGLMIFAVYSGMGLIMASMTSAPADYEYKIVAVNMPSSLVPEFDKAGLSCEEIGENDVDQARENIKTEKIDVLVVFPVDFDLLISMRESIPSVVVYCDSTRTESQEAYNAVANLLESYENNLSNLFDVTMSNLADEKELVGTVMATIMPMLLLVMLFTGALSVTPESIAGEKERGTIAALLVTPAKRSHIALGKVSALSLIALLSGLSSSIGVLASVPQIIGDSVISGGVSYSFGDYALLASVIMSTTVLFVGILSIVSAFAKTVKEATSWSSPLMFVAVAISFATMFVTTNSPFAYVVPLYNSAQCMSSVFSFSVVPVNFVITVISNVVYTGLCVFALTKMFNNEKIMFSK